MNRTHNWNQHVLPSLAEVQFSGHSPPSPPPPHIPAACLRCSYPGSNDEDTIDCLLFHCHPLSRFTPALRWDLQKSPGLLLRQRLAGLVRLGEHSNWALGMSKWTAPQSKPPSRGELQRGRSEALSFFPSFKKKIVRFHSIFPEHLCTCTICVSNSFFLIQIWLYGAKKNFNPEKKWNQLFSFKLK